MICLESIRKIAWFMFFIALIFKKIKMFSKCSGAWTLIHQIISPALYHLSMDSIFQIWIHFTQVMISVVSVYLAYSAVLNLTNLLSLLDNAFNYFKYFKPETVLISLVDNLFWMTEGLCLMKWPNKIISTWNVLCINNFLIFFLI